MSNNNNTGPAGGGGGGGDCVPVQNDGTDIVLDDADDLSANKKAALAGQWRTPPAPAYPSGPSSSMMSSTTTQQQHTPEIPAPEDITAPTTLPGTSEDYAKALQEAYRKGAEAAARMAQQNGTAAQAATAATTTISPPIPHVYSATPCLDFTATANALSPETTGPAGAPSYSPGGVPDPLAGTVTTAPASAAGAAMPPPSEHVYQQQQPHQQQPQLVVLDHVQYTQPVQHTYTHQQEHQHQPQSQQLHFAPAATSATAGAHLPPQTIVYMHHPSPTASPYPSVANSVHNSPAFAIAGGDIRGSAPQIPAPPTTTSAGIPNTGAPGPLATAAGPAAANAAGAFGSSSAKPPASTSSSSSKVPTMRTAVSMPDMSAYTAKAEEDKRQKRLARNRASARLRRLRKKNLVDAYETEVGILEKTLRQLQAHEWGKEDNPKALIEALGMERGQQAIAPEQRMEIIQDILQQQMQQVQLLRQAQMEQQCLALLANQDGPDSYMGDFDDDLARELQDILQLTDDQKSQLRESSKGLDEEVEALETVAASLQAMHDNEWLVNEGVQKMTDQFMSILHKNQQSKFLLWTDVNAEAIDQLDYVQVQPLQNAPLFTFGIETNPGDDDDK